ncbi:hypothetical protein KCTC32516_00127 [Polaribacter huanghezhanensis]|uniref:DUF2141 domain-containing protein n=1 Tax=Polaribacter huanghezhanensis TaxID=1354726 RepID=UPI002648B2AF|nr:DUF2141 domain-containing protein [Polaribacter huanghezhanensis]WKD84793.1 hypothetical protein KCTC32516_00127 [Polaribacter huanghezhanensis]
MQKVILTLVCIITSFFFQAFSQEKETHTITVTISGMTSDKGDVFVALYNSEKDFLNKSFKGTIVKVSAKKATAVFDDIENGIYAISVFHDENDNKKLDTRIFGIPKEPIGCSNGATGFMGPPKFKDAKFNVTKDISIPVKVE